MTDAERNIYNAATAAAQGKKTLIDRVIAAENAAITKSWDCLENAKLSDELKGIFARALTTRALLQIFGKAHEVVPRPGNLIINPSKPNQYRRGRA